LPWPDHRTASQVHTELPMTGEPFPSVAAAWDAEYAAGRYVGEPPVAFARDILAAARQAGLYIGCGNGRNYLPLVVGGLDLTGLDISATAIAQLSARAPRPPRPRRPQRSSRYDRLPAGDRDPGLPAR
jgi:hypothetical protein